MEWVIKLETKSGWGEVETIEVGSLERRIVGLTGEEVGLTVSEGDKNSHFILRWFTCRQPNTLAFEGPPPRLCRSAVAPRLYEPRP